VAGSSPGSPAALLRRFRPVIQYDSQESFYADSCAEITDLVVGSGQPPGGHCNFLKRANNSIVAAASPTANQAQLSLGLLAGQNYGDGQPVQRGDFLDEVGRDYVGDARVLHAKAKYADRIFGHAVRDRDGNLWLDYWFWHYYNDKAFLGFGLHEGDWEGIQIRLDANGEPDQATYAQHSGGQRASWNQLEHQATPDGPVPVVHSARGSHASYMRKGQYDSAPLVPDHNDGLGPRRRPQVIVISDNAPAWVGWPGRWGSTQASLPVEADSPKGPSQHLRWHDPIAFHAQAAPPPAAAPGTNVGASLPRRPRRRSRSDGKAIGP
jgi:hypothetical protein